MSGKRPVGRPQTRWLDYTGESWLEPFRTTSKRNVLCVRGSRDVAAKSGAVAPAALKQKRVKKKQKKKNIAKEEFRKQLRSVITFFLLKDSYLAFG